MLHMMNVLFVFVGSPENILHSTHTSMMIILMAIQQLHSTKSMAHVLIKIHFDSWHSISFSLINLTNSIAIITKSQYIIARNTVAYTMYTLCVLHTR